MLSYIKIFNRTAILFGALFLTYLGYDYLLIGVDLIDHATILSNFQFVMIMAITNIIYFYVAYKVNKFIFKKLLTKEFIELAIAKLL